MNVFSLAIAAVFWSCSAFAASGPDMNRRNFLIGTATCLATLKAPNLQIEAVAAVAAPPFTQSPLLSRIGNVIFLNPLSLAELRMIADLKLKDYGIRLNKLMTDDAFERLIEIRQELNADFRTFDDSLKELISVYKGEPITFDQLRFYLEGVPIPEPQPSSEKVAQLSALDRLRQKLLSSCSYLLIHSDGVELLPQSADSYPSLDTYNFTSSYIRQK